MKQLRKIMVVLLSLIVVLSSTPAFANADTNLKANLRSANLDSQIQSLLDDRAKLLIHTNVDQNVLDKIDTKLHKLGVQFLSTDEVNKQFPQSKAIKALETVPTTTSGAAIQPYYVTPTSPVNQYLSYRSNFYANGNTYNIQRLIVQPYSTSSPLYKQGSRTITFDTNWQAGVANALTAVGTAVAGSLYETVANVALTLYSVVSGFVSGITRTTEVDVPNITYTWSSNETVVFTYVRLESQTDDYQWLSEISTKTLTAVGWQIPTFSYKLGSLWLLTPQIISGSQNISITPSGYDNITNAVAQYNSGLSGPRLAEVSSIQISGPESKTVQYISPVCPNFPLQCEP
jgi:hypothetical protein